jgi:hypothetical protein
MLNYLKEKFKKIPRHIWILLAIILVGIFLRTYNFHDWLDFKTDQSRDATLVSDVMSGKSAWPLLGPTMNGSASTPDGQYHIGPMYYYFQILSAKIFGNYPDKLAYPDLFFAILSIPIFYVFLKKYFERNISLWLCGLYSISFFAVRFAHFAWNSNSIPFFALLFLLSIYEFRKKEEYVSWLYVVTLGIAWGIGFQLHAISMVLFSLVCLYFFIVSIVAKPTMWKKWLVVFTVFLILNLGQITSEFKHNFSDTRIFFQFFSKSDTDESEQKISFFSKVGRDVDCHIEANFYMLSSLGEDNCSFYAAQIAAKNKSKGFLRNLEDPFFDLGLLSGLLFSVLGYALLSYNYKKDASDRRIFINILSIYILFSFLVMIPVMGGDVEFRYFNIVFFVPFIFLGLCMEYLAKYYSKLKKTIFYSLGLIIIASNFFTLLAVWDNYSRKNGINSHQVILGEIEPIVQYMTINSKGQSDIYIGGDYEIMAFIYNPVAYLMQRNGISLNRVADKNKFSLPSGKDLYYLSYKSSLSGSSEYEKIGKIYVYKLNN